MARVKLYYLNTTHSESLQIHFCAVLSIFISNLPFLLTSCAWFWVLWVLALRRRGVHLGLMRPCLRFWACLISLEPLGSDKQVVTSMTSNPWPQCVVLCIDLYIFIPWAAEYISNVPIVYFFCLCVSVLGSVSFSTPHCFIILTMLLRHPHTLNLCPLTFFMQKKNGAMDSDDFRACLISMGYDLVGP